MLDLQIRLWAHAWCHLMLKLVQVRRLKNKLHWLILQRNSDCPMKRKILPKITKEFRLSFSLFRLFFVFCFFNLAFL